MTIEENTQEASGDQGGQAAVGPIPPWVRASMGYLANLDLEAPVAQSQSADSAELGDLFQAAAGPVGENGELSYTPAGRVFSMLAAVARMLFKPKEPNEPFAATAVFADLRGSAVLSDFRGAPVDMLANIAARANYPVLRARLPDVCSLLDRKKAQFGASAASAYLERYNILCRRLAQERLYTTATIMASPRTAATTGEFSDLFELTGLKTFITSFAGHIAAEAAG